MNDKSVKLIECFSSYQGEGVDTGQKMLIMRFKTCNLKCPWCDTSVKMRISNEARYYLSDIQETIDKDRCGIMITGGEPTVPKHFNEALMLLNDLDYSIANVESNGFNLLNLIKSVDETKNVHFTYSPKIFNAEDLRIAKEITFDLLEEYSSVVYIKLVYQYNAFINEYCRYLYDLCSESKYYDNKVWLMPEGVTREQLIKNSGSVIDACEQYKFNFSSRNHIIFGFI